MDTDPDAKHAARWLILYLLFLTGFGVGFLLWWYR